MAKLSYGTDTTIGPDSVLLAAVNFTGSRPEYWPNLSRKFYRVHELRETSAEVTEGSDVMGGIWARERYDWSKPGVVRATVQDSNVFQSGGVWELRALPKNGGGTRIEVLNHRQAKGLKGHLMGAMIQLSARKGFEKQLHELVATLERAIPEHQT
jgi:hypothetical protein